MASKVAGYIGKMNPGDGTQYSLGSTAYGVCETAAATAAKVVDMTGFTLMEGATIFVKFTNQNSAANPTLNVNGTGAKPMYQYGTTAMGAGTSTNGWRAGAILSLTYDGKGWVRTQWDNSTYHYESVYTNTSGNIAAKIGTATNYNLTAGKYFQVLVINSNTAQSALTLNIGNKGAKPIYINGAASSASNYTLPSGYYLVYYDGANYYFRTDGKMTGNITGNAAKASFMGAGAHPAAVAANEFTPSVGSATLVGSVNNTTMPHINNANAEMIIKAHPTVDSKYYESRLGFSGNGRLYYMPTNTNSWKTIAYTDDIPDRETIYNENMGSKWYHIKMSNTSTDRTGFYTIATIKMQSDYGSYSAGKIFGYLYDHNSNWESNETYKIPFIAIVDLTHDTATLYSTVIADLEHIRIWKVDTRWYEVQVRGNAAHIDWDCFYQTSGFGITPYTNLTAPSTTGAVVNSLKQLKSYGNKAYEAEIADKVKNNLVLKIKSGSTEGTNLYTFNGSAAKTLDIKQGTGISLTAAAGSLTIANSGVRSVATGSVDGTISVNTNGTTANVAVKGLGSNAYSSTAYIPLNTSGGLGNITGQGKYSYCTIATINTTETYINYPIVFEISGRGIPFTTLQVLFKNSGAADPDLHSFTTDCSDRFYIYKTNTSEWTIYGQYSDRYGNLTLHRITGNGSSSSRVTIALANVDALPEGSTQVINSTILTSIGTDKGDILYWSAASIPTRLKIGSNGQVLKVINGEPTWSSDTNTDTKNTAGSTDTSSKIFLIGATNQATNPQTYSDNEVYTTNGVLTAKTFHSTSLVASQAVSTDANKNLVSTNLTTASPATSGQSLEFIDSISQNAVGKITATKKKVNLSGIYWANIQTTTAAQYDKEPVVKSVTVGNGSGATAPTKKVQMVYDDTLEVLNFVFA